MRLDFVVPCVAKAGASGPLPACELHTPLRFGGGEVLRA